jgi:hypothetical protein
MCHNNEPIPLDDGKFRHYALHVVADRGLRGGLGGLVIGVASTPALIGEIKW